MQSIWIGMSSTYCMSCKKQVGDNWPECYFCGGKNLRERDSSSVSSICAEDLLPRPPKISILKNLRCLLTTPSILN